MSKYCFISAPFGVDLRILTQTLISRGYALNALDSLYQQGESFSRNVESAIKESELVVGVIPVGNTPSRIMFELGIAFAHRKRILLIVDPDSEGIPSDWSSIVYLKAKPDNSEAISFALEQIDSAPTQLESKRRTKKKERSHDVGRPLTHYGRKIAEEGSESELIEMLAGVIVGSGVDTVASQSAPNFRRGADIAIWSDTLQPTFKNPFLIEVKANIGSIRAADSTADQALRYLSKSKSNWILILYRKGKSQAVDYLSDKHPGFIVLSVSEFLERLQGRSFDCLLRELRNEKIAHRVGSWQ